MYIQGVWDSISQCRHIYRRNLLENAPHNQQWVRFQQHVWKSRTTETHKNILTFRVFGFSEFRIEQFVDKARLDTSGITEHHSIRCVHVASNDSIPLMSILHGWSQKKAHYSRTILIGALCISSTRRQKKVFHAVFGVAKMQLTQILEIASGRNISFAKVSNSAKLQQFNGMSIE